MAGHVEERAVKHHQGFVVLHADGLELLAHETTGFFNATQLCQQGDKNYAHYANNKRSADLDAALRFKFDNEVLLSADSSWMNLPSPAPVHGVYVHPLKLLDVACWLSNEVYVKCALAANAFFARTAQRVGLLQAILKIDASVDAVELAADEGGWINASRLCRGGKEYEVFARDAGTGKLLDSLRRYLGEWPYRRRGPVDSAEPTDDTYVHPIVAIRVLLWRNPNVYSRLAGVILARLCAATAATSNNHQAETSADVAAGAQNQDSCDISLVGLCQASASTTPVGSPSRQHDRSAAPGPDSEQPKKKARVEESEIERLRRKLRSKKNEVERLSSKRAKEAKEQQALKKELEELRSVAKRRRCALERRIGELAERRGEGALECVLAVRLRSLPHALYAFRLDLGRLAPTVMDRLEEVDEFLFWYATDDAQRDFEEAKSAADGVAGSRAHVRLQTTPNAIRVVAADGGAPAAADEAAELARNVATAVEGALRAMGLLEMDVGVLRALFRDQRPDDLNEFVVNASSEIVHNWTVEQTADWLSSNVELPQYVPLFIVKRVTGAHLPRLASANGQYITNVLGIKDPIHRQKIMLKAMDVVLFGPPKENVNFAKDVVLITLLAAVSIVCYYVYRKYQYTKNHVRRMMFEYESLQKAELNYQNLEKELERAKQEQEYAATEKQNLEKQLREQSSDGNDLHNSNSNYSLEVTQLKEEVECLRNALQRAEGELVDRYWSPPPGLQLWLQLTHEIENKTYNAKKVAAEKQLQAARDACEKLKRKRSSLVGAFVSTHGKSIDDVDRSIVDARTALNEVTQDLAERVHRWKQIESLCGFPVISNKGLAFLEGVLYKNSINGRNLGFRGRMSSQDNLDDETSSNYSVPTGMSFTDRPAYENINSWTEGQETSDSDKLEPEDEEDSSRSNVQFIVGASEADDHSCKNNVHVASHSAVKDREFSNFSIKSNNRNVKSIAEEHNGVSHDSEISKKSSPLRPNPELSASAEHIQKVKRPPRKSELVHSASVSTASTMDDEACSTDSNSAAMDDPLPAEPKKTKTKLKMFPRFGRKISKNNPSAHAHSE